MNKISDCINIQRLLELVPELPVKLIVWTKFSQYCCEYSFYSLIMHNVTMSKCYLKST